MIEVSEEQVLYFRAKRGHLAGPGAASARDAARAILGAQSQQLNPSLLALSQRTKGRPTAARLKAELLEGPRGMVRTWGQRDTLHVYDAAAHWPLVVAARDDWSQGGRRGVMPTRAILEAGMKRIRALVGPVTRRDLFDIVPASFVKAAALKLGRGGDEARRLAAGRVLWQLALQGDACMADKAGAEQYYALRSAWFPKLAWPKKAQGSRQAAAQLARDYLSAYGPATAADVAHFFGATVASARAWFDALGAGALVPVACGERRNLVALSDDARELVASPPRGAGDWPPRLLPMWDCLLMGHADKSWTVPEPAERKIVWAKAAMVAAVVLARGRVVATWSQEARAGRMHLEVRPLSGWSTAKHAAAVRREAAAVAGHLDLDGADVKIW